MARTFTKDPNEVLDYTINWETLLDGDTILTSSWEVESGLTADSDSNTTTTATIWVSGGTEGATYTLTNTIVTAGGRTIEESITITISSSAASTGYYTTLAEVRDRLGIGVSYRASTLSFDAGTNTISDSALGLEMFTTGMRIAVSGSNSNDGTFTVTSGGVAASLTVSEDLADESVGALIAISDVSDVVSDRTLSSIISAVSRAIDLYCRRRFYRNADDEVRYYKAVFPDVLLDVDDIGSITSLRTDSDGDRTYEDTWSSADYDLMPANAELDGEPYVWVEISPNGNYTFPVGVNRGVELVGKFGYADSAPEQIAEACALLVLRVFKKRDVLFGVMGGPGLGFMRVLQKMIEDDMELLLLLGPFRKAV